MTGQFNCNIVKQCVARHVGDVVVEATVRTFVLVCTILPTNVVLRPNQCAQPLESSSATFDPLQESIPLMIIGQNRAVNGETGSPTSQMRCLSK